jgi:hypothetical protein
MGNNNLRLPGAIALLSAVRIPDSLPVGADAGPRELLDERTGATLIVVSSR